ncbi:Bcssvp1 [Botrytis cinerea B05.10]|uniref:Bcssvp1 n=1 Tax=Botryotinia fuckeliana (strain B05.10) TaxID=332648 RepID=A0A384JMK0_BOTFB|nr:Bcssvp1 [Botrytis cinerea B05.10]ATZ51594.1 Bcssvp1 [Botrytis cinerea B05.10]
MKLFLFISALVAFITATLAGTVPLESRQSIVGLWGKSTDIAVQYCYMDAACMQMRENWQFCQVDLFKNVSEPIGNPNARNELVADCLCKAGMPDLTSECLACISLDSQNFLVQETLHAHALDFGSAVQFPLILPSLWLNGTKVTSPDQILIDQ